MTGLTCATGSTGPKPFQAAYIDPIRSLCPAKSAQAFLKPLAVCNGVNFAGALRPGAASPWERRWKRRVSWPKQRVRRSYNRRLDWLLYPEAEVLCPVRSSGYSRIRLHVPSTMNKLNRSTFGDQK